MTDPKHAIVDEAAFEERIAQYRGLEAPMRAMLALDAGRMGSWSWDIVGGTVEGDPFVARLLGLDYEAQPWAVDDVFISMDPQDLPTVQAAVDRALYESDWYEVEFRANMVDLETNQPGQRWLGARGRVTERDGDNAPLRMIGVNWDATTQKTQEERLALLAGEMDHRVKNAFAVIRALINVGARSDADKVSFAATLRTQVEAMAEAHALSAKMARANKSPEQGVPLAEVINSALSPWLEGECPDNVAVSVDLDDSFILVPREVSPMSMLVYELATNAVKYGALGEAGGTLTVSAVTNPDKTGTIYWRETVADQIAVPADDSSHPGFGTVLIQHCTNTLRAKVARSYRKDGLDLQISLPKVRG